MEIDDKDVPDVSGNEVFLLDCENYDLNGFLDSFSTENSYDWNLEYAHEDSSKGMTSLHGDTFCLSDLLKDPIEAQVVLSDRESNDVLLNSLIDKNSCFDAWSGEVSSFDLMGQQLASEIWPQEVVNVCFAEENAFSSTQLPVQDSALTSLHHVAFQDKLQNSLDNQHSSQSGVVTDANLPLNSDTIHEFFESLDPVDMSEEFLKFSSIDDLCHWFAPSLEDSICRTGITLDNTLSESIEFNPSSSDHIGSSSENNILDGMELDLSFDKADEWWGNILTPVVSAAATTSSSFSQSQSEMNIGTMSSPGKQLFSESGIEELLRGESNCSPFNSLDFGYGLSSNKRQMVELSPMNRNPINFANLAGNEARANLRQPVSDLEKPSNLLSKKDAFKLQVGMLNDDRHSFHIGRAIPDPLQKQKEPEKPTGKGARPRESTRPRPKDRQQIQDCIKELRRIIPNGGKCSIDYLLDLTVRYMLFLRSRIKYADKLQEPHEPKLIDQANGEVPKDSRVGDRQNNGVTCAFEVAHQTMASPIIVEDMSLPGHMLIEMLCEEQGFFLEIVDTIKGSGLNILKGKMEIRKNKLWSCFIVEANKHVTRIDVFWYLLHLLQQTNTSGVDYANMHSNVIDANIS